MSENALVNDSMTEHQPTSFSSTQYEFMRPQHNVKIILGDMNAKAGKEQSAAHASTIKNICKVTWISPDELTKNQIVHFLIHQRHGSDVKDVRACRGADADSDHFMVHIKYKQRIANISKERSRNEMKFSAQNYLRGKAARENYQKVIRHDMTLCCTLMVFHPIPIDRNKTRAPLVKSRKMDSGR